MAAVPDLQPFRHCWTLNVQRSPTTPSLALAPHKVLHNTLHRLTHLIPFKVLVWPVIFNRLWYCLHIIMKLQLHDSFSWRCSEFYIYARRKWCLGVVRRSSSSPGYMGAIKSLRISIRVGVSQRLRSPEYASSVVATRDLWLL